MTCMTKDILIPFQLYPFLFFYVLGFCIEVNLPTTCDSLECQGTKTGCHQWTSSTSWVRTIPTYKKLNIFICIHKTLSFQHYCVFLSDYSASDMAVCYLDLLCHSNQRRIWSNTKTKKLYWCLTTLLNT